MATQVSYSKHENDIMHEFRNKLGKAESTEDVKKVFNYSIKSLLEKIVGDQVPIKSDDLFLDLTQEQLYMIHSRLFSHEIFKKAWESSDLPNIINRFAQNAENRHIHLEKHNEKTNSKIRR